MVAGSYSFSDDAAGHKLEQINLSQSSSLTFGATQHLFELNVNDFSTATLDADGLRLLHLRALSVSSDSILNLTNNGMILDTGDIGAIRDLIKLGLDTGMGLVSFSASNRLLGVRSNSGPLYTSFLGEPNLNGSEILVRYTVVGDLNLDRQVSIGDFIDLSSHFGQSPANWGEGDVNYDDSVSIADFIALASNFGQSFSGNLTPAAPLSVTAGTASGRTGHHRSKALHHVQPAKQRSCPLLLERRLAEKR